MAQNRAHPTVFGCRGEYLGALTGGVGGIRTHGTVTRTTVFETALPHNEIVFGIGGFESGIWTYFWASRSKWSRVRYRWLRVPATIKNVPPSPEEDGGRFLCESEDLSQRTDNIDLTVATLVAGVDLDPID
jgi:hypothetical protein